MFKKRSNYSTIESFKIIRSCSVALEDFQEIQLLPSFLNYVLRILFLL